jgi:hypothetical protein
MALAVVRGDDVTGVLLQTAPCVRVRRGCAVPRLSLRPLPHDRNGDPRRAVNASTAQTPSMPKAAARSGASTSGPGIRSMRSLSPTISIDAPLRATTNDEARAAQSSAAAQRGPPPKCRPSSGEENPATHLAEHAFSAGPPSPEGWAGGFGDRREGAAGVVREVGIFCLLENRFENALQYIEVVDRDVRQPVRRLAIIASCVILENGNLLIESVDSGSSDC